MANEITQTVDRTLLALIEIAERGPLTIKEMSEALQIGMTSARRIIVTLHEEGMVRRRIDGRYDLGPRLIRMTDSMLLQYAERAEPHMEVLSASCGLTVLLSGFQADGVAVFHQSVPDWATLHIDFRTGSWREMTVSSDGLAILSQLTGSRRARILNDASSVGLETRLAEIRDAGFVVQRNTEWGQLPAISAPIFDSRLGVIGSLSVVGTSVEEDLYSLAADVRATAAAIGQSASLHANTETEEDGRT